MIVPAQGYLYIYSNGETKIEWFPKCERLPKYNEPSSLTGRTKHYFRYKGKINGLLVHREVPHIADEEFFLTVPKCLKDA